MVSEKSIFHHAILSWRWLTCPVFFMMLATWSVSAEAQGLHSFTVGGKTISYDWFNGQVTQLMRSAGVPGMSLAIIDHNKIVFYNAYGIRQQSTHEKADRNTIFDGCSLSKTYLAFVAYQLVDEGKLDLDRPMYEYLPYAPLEYDPRYKRITARMVLSHSSGLENWLEDNNPDTLEIVSDPGTKYVYSGEGYQYLAKVMEKLTHLSYEQYIRRRVLNPLGLKHTYLRFRQKGLPLFRRESPKNYAAGHQFGKSQTAFRNYGPVPASGVHFNAWDYARLIISLFDTSFLSARRIHDMLGPQVRVDNSSTWYAPGFELFTPGDDTIIAHGGIKPGYKNLIFYSVRYSSGFVLMTNSDRGAAIAEKLNGMTVGLNITEYLQSHLYYQAPSDVFDLINICEEKGYDAMFAALKQLMEQGKNDANTLDGLGHYFSNYADAKTAKVILENAIRLYPDSSLAYVLLADLYMDENRVELAYKRFMKARELHFSMWDIDEPISKCEQELAAIKKRQDAAVTIGSDAATMLRAEEYSDMDGVRVQLTSDSGGGRNLGYIDREDWMEYKINVLAGGGYSVIFRVASLSGGGEFELRSDDTTLATVKVDATNGWQNWVSLKTGVHLQPGIHTVRIYAIKGGFNLNWLKFSPSE